MNTNSKGTAKEKEGSFQFSGEEGRGDKPRSCGQLQNNNDGAKTNYSYSAMKKKEGDCQVLP